MNDSQNQSLEILKLQLLIAQEKTKRIQLEEETQRKRLEEETKRKHLEEETQRKRLEEETKQRQIQLEEETKQRQIQLEEETKRTCLEEETKRIYLEEQIKRIQVELSLIDEEESSKRQKVEDQQMSLSTKTRWTELSPLDFYNQYVKNNTRLFDIDLLLKD
ncbi:unnamed protein product [Rotaria magnacalcarata]|uniref:Uncharacterized protein n=1 Tax=Rotaria magnacalcarata TaxID=392030 RepID=A0A816NPU0_9BILA|nr:unnamed protein product [Rotaria magnacalcarata]CAF3774460.1 unnamed protein product [Rotaria magnacalcarata]